MTNIVIFCALKDEIEETKIGNCNIVFTGVGKVNAAISASKYLSQNTPSLAINYGTAGVIRNDIKGLVECGSAVQRDFDLRPLGFPLGANIGQETPEIIRWSSGYHIATGDQFSTMPPEINCDLVDMEAFALAKACQSYRVPFRCVKFISDSSDTNAAQEWKQKLAQGASLFKDWLEENHNVLDTELCPPC